MGRLSTGNGNVELLPIGDFIQHVLTTQAIGKVTTLGGDVTGSTGANTVGKIQGNPVQAGTPRDGAILRYSAADAQWDIKAEFSSFIVVDSSHYYVAMVVSLSDPEVVLSGGVPIYVLNPGFTP